MRARLPACTVQLPAHVTAGCACAQAAVQEWYLGGRPNPVRVRDMCAEQPQLWHLGRASHVQSANSQGVCLSVLALVCERHGLHRDIPAPVALV